jgi:hypothetical protein
MITFATGQVFAGELLCAESEAIFVSASPERFRKLLEERERWESRRAEFKGSD